MCDISKQITILVTGASGFVGRVLCRQLVADGHDVVGSTRSAADLEPDVRRIVVPTLAADTDWGAALEGVDVVMHLAARVHVMHDDAADPLTAFQAANLHGSANLARQAAAARVRRFVYISSVKVHGEYTDGKPFSEADTPRPQDPYGQSKWQAEKALHEICRETGMELVIIRPPLVYGPGVRANFYRLLRLADRAWPLPLGSVTNRRGMIFVDNLVDALALCATHPAAAGQTYLVSDGEDVSVPQLIREIAEAMGRPARLPPFPPGLLRFAAMLCGKSAAADRLLGSLELDVGAIRQTLGWQPPYTRQQGLRATVDWFLRQKAAND